MALQTGLPVAASQTTVVSRWLVMPMAAISSGWAPSEATASIITPDSVAQISIGSCSTQPGCGKCCVNSFWLTDRALPSWSKTMARLLLVPWSRAITYFFIVG